MLLRVLSFFLFCLLIIVPSAQAADRSVEYFISNGSEGSLSFQQNAEAGLLIEIKSDGRIISTYTGVADEILPKREADPFLKGTHFKLEDYNFDGFTDIAISSSVGFGALNVYFNIHVFEPDENRFSEAIIEICNPSISTSKKQAIISDCTRTEDQSVRIIDRKIETID